LPPDGLEHLEIGSDQGREKVIQEYTTRLIAWAKEDDEIKNTTLAVGQLKFASSSSMTSIALKSRRFQDSELASS